MSAIITMKEQIESLNKQRQIEVLKIFIENEVPVSENKNGIFINLSTLENNVLHKLTFYLIYVSEQDNTLKEIEDVKKEFHELIENYGQKSSS